jgi:hypothetical protein
MAAQVERELRLTPKVIDSALPAPPTQRTFRQPDRSTQADLCFALIGAEEAVVIRTLQAEDRP